MNRLTQAELADTFGSLNPKHYFKTGFVQARKAVPGERVVTVIEGEEETANTAGEDDVVVTGAAGEVYILGREKFEGRYTGSDLRDHDQTYQATGSTWAVTWPVEQGYVLFTASWGEDMILNPGDALCSIDREPNGDLYRVDADVFAKTYTAHPTYTLGQPK